MFSSVKSAVGLGPKQPEFLDGLTVKEPLPFPGFYETCMRPASKVLWPRTHGRSAKIVVGNPINESFGTQFELKLDGSALHPQQAAQQQGLPQKRMRHFRAGGFYRSPGDITGAGAGASTVQAMLDQSGYVHARASQTIGKRTQAVFAATAGRTASPYNVLSGRVAYRGDTWSGTMRARTVAKTKKADVYPFVGGSAMKSLTKHLSVAGEAYVHGGNYAYRKVGKNPIPWYIYSGTALWRQSDWLAAVQYSSRPVGPYMFMTFARTLSPNVSLATQLLVAPTQWRSRVKLGTSITMPHTRSKLQVSYDTQGTMQTVWERRLLSTVSLQVTGELSLWNFKQQDGAPNSNKFGICLQIGSVPQPPKSETPVLQILGYHNDIRPQM